MGKRMLLGLVGIVLAGSVALGAYKTVILKNGGTVTGEVTETPEGYEVKKKLGTKTLGTMFYKRADVAKVVDAVSPTDEYDKRRAAVDDQDPDQLYKLALWAYEKKKMYKRALADLEAALKLKPDHVQAGHLLKAVNRKLSGSTTPVGPRATPTVAAAAEAKDLVSEEDIYRIRIAEIDLRWDDDTRRIVGVDRNQAVRVKFRKKVVERFIDKMRGVEEFRRERFDRTFLRLPRHRQLAYMLSKLQRGETAFLDDILIETDPLCVRQFRQFIWPMIARSCGQAQCHGGLDKKGKPKGGMKLFLGKGLVSRTEYTNFTVLGGIKKSKGRYVLDRSQHMDSLLLQFGLPRKQAKYHHPIEIKPPLLRNEKDINYRRMLQWIRTLRGPNHPDYRLKWVPPYGMSLDTSGRIDLDPGDDDDDEDKKKSGAGDKKDDDTPF